MTQRLGFIACASFDREILAIQASPEFQDVPFKILPVDCDLVEAPWPGLGDAVASFRKSGCPVALLGGYCLTRPAKDLDPDLSCRIHQRSQCLEWIADKDVLDRFLVDSALLVLPGWVRDWEAHVEARWPSDPKGAQAFFRELARKVVLLDTGVYPGIDHELKAFARFLRLPCEAHPVGLEHFKLCLGRIVLAWRLERAEETTDGEIAIVRRQVADFARISLSLGVGTNVRTMAEAQAGVLELFRVLLSPRDVVYHALESLSGRPPAEGTPLDRIIGLNADYAWADDRRTLYLRIGLDREILGVLELVDFAGPQRHNHDFNLALALARISSLALMNARVIREIGQERERASSAEARLAAGEEKMSQLFTYPLGLYRITPQGQILDAAPTLIRMLGYPSLEALKAVNFWDIHHNPHDRDSWQAVLDSSPRVEIFETQLRRANGTLFWARDFSHAAKDPQGNVLFYDGIIEDITRKKQMEDEHSWDVRLRGSVGDVSERLLSPTSIEEMSTLIMEHARRLTSSASAMVGYIDERTGKFVATALTPDARDMLGEHFGGDGSIHENAGMWRWVLEKKRPVLTNMTRLDQRFTGMPDWHFPVRQFLAVPAIMSGNIVGLIVVANSENPYVERDLQAVDRLATLYAIAVHRARTENELRELSLVDELTKVYNRRGFMTLAEQQVKVAHRTRKDMSLFYADLDDLKKINDSFGHKAGDAALVEAAELLRDVFRDSDIIARLGGDEFVVLAIDIAEGKVAAITRRLREKIQARNASPDNDYDVSFSLGVVRYDPDRPSSLQELLILADRKMYQDKLEKKTAAATA